MKCPKCGKEVADGAKFCDGCGAPMEAPAPAPAQAEAPAQAAAPTPAPAPQPQAAPAQEAAPQPAPQAAPVQTQQAAPAQVAEPAKKKSKKGLVIGLIIAAVVLLAAVLLIVIIIAVVCIFGFGNKSARIKSAYNDIFHDMEKKGTIKMTYGDEDFDAGYMINNYSYYADGSNVYSSFYYISSNDEDKVWDIICSNVEYDVVSVEKEDDDYLVEVEISNRNMYDAMNTAVSDFNYAYGPVEQSTGDTVTNIIGAVLDANNAYANSSGGFLGEAGQIANGIITGFNSYDQSSSGYDNSGYYAGLENGSNAATIVDWFADNVDDTSYDSTTTLYFYATQDSDGDWCIPDTVYYDDPSYSYGYDSYSAIYNAFLGN